MKTPSPLTLLLAAAAFSVTPAFADLLIYEPFNYSPVGTNIIGQTDLITSATATWAQAGSAATTVHQVAAGSLSGLPFTLGNMGDMKGADFNEYGRMGLGATYNANTTPNFTLYYSLLLNVPSTAGLTVAHSNVNANNDGIIAYNNSTGSQAGHPTLWAGELVIRQGSAAGTFNLGIRATSTAAGTTYFSGDLNTNQTYVVVTEYAAGAAGGATGTNSIWLNPDSSTFGTTNVPTADGQTAGNLSTTTGPSSGDTLASLIIGAGIAAGACPSDTYIDEIRVGTTWADVTATNLPARISSQPKNLRALIGSKATLSVGSVFASAFQWYHNGSPVVNGTQNPLILNPVQPSDAGTYYVLVGNGTPNLISSNATVAVFPDIYPRLTPLWSLAPGSRPYLTTDGVNAPYERCIAYNSLSNTVLIVSRTNTATMTGGPSVYVLDANTAADLYAMNTAGISGGASSGAIMLNCIDVAADGGVVAANVSDGNNNFSLYYWTDSNSNTAPVQVFTGADPAGQTGQTWGGSLAVRGAGANTQVMLDSTAGTYGALLMPTAGQGITLPDSWSGDGQGHYAWFTNSAGGQTGGRTLLFYGTDNTFWEKHGGAGNFNLLSYDTSATASTIVTNILQVTGGSALAALSPATNVMVIVVFSSSSSAPDTLDQYDVSDPSQPLYIQSYPFPVNHQGNGNGCGRVIFAGDRVYALDSNNGMAAWTLVPVLHITPQDQNVVLSWSGETPGYTLKASPSVIPPTTWTNVSTGTLVGSQYFATNDASASTLFYRLQK